MLGLEWRTDFGVEQPAPSRKIIIARWPGKQQEIAPIEAGVRRSSDDEIGLAIDKLGIEGREYQVGFVAQRTRLAFLPSSPR